jgi:hypothetical protein
MVHRELCPSGPTSIPWGMLAEGIPALGRTPVTFWGGVGQGEGKATGQVRDHCRAAFDLVARETAEGRPCVLWGTYVPEFGIAYAVTDDAYLVKSYRTQTGEAEAPIPFDELATPGGPYVLAFPEPADLGPVESDRRSVVHAVATMRYRTGWPQYRSGLDVYAGWIAALEAGTAEPFGNAYNAQCWAEARRLATEFLARMSRRYEALRPLHRAASAMEGAAASLERIASRFPFPGTADHMTGPAISGTVTDLRAAAAADERALAELQVAAATMF